MNQTESLLNFSPSQLRRAAELKERIDALNDELATLLNGAAPVAGNSQGRPRRKMSAEGRRRIAEAARARWARERAAKGGAVVSTAVTPKKRKMSAAARKRIADAAKARWARYRAEKGG